MLKESKEAVYTWPQIILTQTKCIDICFGFTHVLIFLSDIF